MKKISGLNFKSKKVAVVAVAIVLAVIIVPRFLGEKEPTFAEVQPPSVEVKNPQKGNISTESTIIGTVEPSEAEYIYPQISGKITGINVKAGQKISAGQVICTIENKQLETSSISLQTAQLGLSNAKTEMERAEALYANGDISTQSYEDTKNALSKAQLSYESASNDYSNQSEYSTVRASIGGTVESCTAEVYDNVSPQTEICVIAGGSEKIVVFEATERIVKNMKVGDSITAEKGGVQFGGTIKEVSTMVDESSGLFKVKATLAKGAEVASGTTLKIEVTADKAGDAMIIPASAVYYENGNAFVYLYEDGKAKKQPVETGISDEENIQVTSGLEWIHQIITTWSAELYDGAEVTVE